MIARFATVLTFALTALAAPPLTTIQDVLYKADGTRFNGVVVINWSSFEAPDTSNITQQSVTVKVIDGNLRVQLVPGAASTPAAYYSVKYNSDGRVQFEEVWSVPVTAQTLRVRDVRVPASTLIQPDTAGGGAITGPVQESDVIGLPADLSARPVKSPGYAAGRAVFVNLQGALESVAGDPAECVRVDGTAGPCGAASPSFVDGDTPSGLVDGSNRLFSLSGSPSPASSLAIYRNGLLMKLTQDYSVSDRVITFVPELTPQPGDTLLATYRTSGANIDTPPLFPPAQVMCSGVGATTTSDTAESLGVCTIPAGILLPGDRLEVRFDAEHEGSSSGFHIEARWGSTVMAQLTAPVAETLVSGRAEAGLHPTGAHLSNQIFGVTSPFAASVKFAADDFVSGIVIEFFGNLTSTSSDTLSLRNFTVVRFP